MDKIKVGIIGAGGYGGCGAIELLYKHPHVEICALIDKQNVGQKISDIYLHLEGFCDLVIQSPDSSELPESLDVVFFATPDGVGQQFASQWLNRGAKVIDYSGDFRFNDLETYLDYASRIGRPREHRSPDLLSQTVYGLPELHREEIKRSSLVGNPGCFAVSCILGLGPAVKDKLIDPQTIICDSKTGVSGAGKNPNPTFHYPARYDTMNAYKISGHQHVFEIEHELSLLASNQIRITFTPHVVPLCRGILSTIYARLNHGVNLQKIKDSYKAFYAQDKFVRVFGPDKPQVSTAVRGSNFCNISLNIDERTGRLIVISLIDNLVKGQAGSAVQNMNIMFGLDEREGLMHPGMYP